MYDLDTIRRMNNEQTPAKELGKALTGTEIELDALKEKSTALNDKCWSEPRNEF